MLYWLFTRWRQMLGWRGAVLFRFRRFSLFDGCVGCACGIGGGCGRGVGLGDGYHAWHVGGGQSDVVVFLVQGYLGNHRWYCGRWTSSIGVGV